MFPTNHLVLKNNPLVVLLVVCFLSTTLRTTVEAGDLNYAPAPVDNPLKGLVPYVGASHHDQFPHTLEFRYFAFSDLMKGWGEYDWEAIESALKETGQRGSQLIFRVYIEYPEKGNQIPDFLIKEGVKVTKWETDGDGELYTPDYNNPKLRRALSEFIAALGAKYDGDPRIAFLTAGILGMWGEWHDYPRDELFASKEVQAEVLQSLAMSFKKTKILLRYPAGEDHDQYVENGTQPFGYHDDSFAWATLDSGREDDDWFYLTTLKDAGPAARAKWKKFPIGGEIRPELWEKIFTKSPHRRQQNFARCVRETHVTWLMDSGLFEGDAVEPARKRKAIEEVRKMGYELHVASAKLADGQLKLTLENRAVAPFYYDWPVELRYSAPNIRTRPVFPKWKLSEILPGQSVSWQTKLGSDKDVSVRIRVPNPMKNGKPLRFANEEVNGEWLELSGDQLR